MVWWDEDGWSFVDDVMWLEVCRVMQFQTSCANAKSLSTAAFRMCKAGNCERACQQSRSSKSWLAISILVRWCYRQRTKKKSWRLETTPPDTMRWRPMLCTYEALLWPYLAYLWIRNPLMTSRSRSMDDWPAHLRWLLSCDLYSSVLCCMR